MHVLRHVDNFSPDKVVRKALEVSSNVLFPSLERKFGIADPKDSEAFEKLFYADSSSPLGAPDSRPGTGRIGGSARQDASFGLSALPSATDLHRSASMQSTGNQQHSRSRSTGKRPAALQIQSLTESRLKTALAEAKVCLRTSNTHVALRIFT